MRKYLILFLCFFSNFYAIAQQDPVLMRIGNKEITRSEFEYSYNKSREIASSERKGLAEYVPLFVDFKLKVLAAEAAGIDTTRAFRDELTGYRRQLAKSYFINETTEDEYARRAYEQLKEKSQGGQVFVMQLFKYLPQNASAVQIRNTQYLVDSIYTVLIQNNGTDFSHIVNEYSDETKPFWVGWLQTSKEFEEVAFSLSKGQISKPFFTPRGLHILKVLDRKKFPPFKDVRDQLIKGLIHRPVLDKGTESLVNKLKLEYKYVAENENIQELYLKGATNKTLFRLAGREYTGLDFAIFAKGHPQELKKQLSNFIVKSILDYENSCLDVKYPRFRYLMQEYREGILLFDIMQMNVWEPAQINEQGLRTFFDAHRKNYFFDKFRYKGIVLHAVNKRTARKAKKIVKKTPYEQWVNLITNRFNMGRSVKVKVESGIFSEGENRYVDKLIYKKKDFVPLKEFPVTKVFGVKMKGPDSYLEVKSAVVSDYQDALDNRWTKLLRTKTKVEIKQEVLKTVNNHGDNQ